MPDTAAAWTTWWEAARGGERVKEAGYQNGFTIRALEVGPPAGAALLFGETMIAWRVWDVMRTIDWIETRKELDARRVGCMGISGGGTCTVFASALEPRIRAAMVSGYLNTFRDSILSLAHCMDNYVPGILHWAEMYDVAGLMAPRPLFVESGERDDIFPIEASRASFARVKQVYEVFGAGAMAEAIALILQDRRRDSLRGAPADAERETVIVE